MLKPRLVVLRGLPGSGKSTYACQLVQQQDYKRFNKDDMRMMIDNGNWSGQNEVFINEAMYNLIELAITAGHNVVVDNTNFHPKHIQRCRFISEWHGAELEIKDFDIPVEVCIERDLNREARVGQQVIRRMYDRYFKDGKFPKVPR